MHKQHVISLSNRRVL